VLQQLAPKAEEEAVVAMTPGQRSLYASLLERGRGLVANRERKGKGRAAKLPSAADNKAAKSLFFDLRKAACHPCLMRSHYTAADMEEMAKAAKAMESFGANATLPMIRKELETNSDFQLHQLCLELPQLRRLCLPHAVLCDSAKVAQLTALLPRLREEGHKVLIFSQWTQMLDIIESILGAPPGLDLPFVRLDGSTAVEERQQLIDSFQAKDSPIFAFLLSTRAGGQGITLTAADTVIIHDLDWNPQLDRQAVDRAHRIGQTRPVRVIRMVTEETVEEQIHTMQQRKAGLDAQLLGDVRKSPHKRGGAAAAPEDDEDGSGVDLDVRMMTTMIHKALAAPFLTTPGGPAFAPANAPGPSNGAAKKPTETVVVLDSDQE
jgi:SWI/SNF-related matrix-associated actin-dependent regulator 1 of chromatin subfamily A